MGLDEPEKLLLKRVAGRLKVPRKAIKHHAIVRRSLDARRGREIVLVYSVELALEGGITAEKRCVGKKFARNVELIQSQTLVPICPGKEEMPHRPVVIGFGPAGMFSALMLAELGYQPIVLERGRDVRTRHKDVLQTFYREGKFNPESNLLYGEGGAGTYSDGKVYSRIGNAEVQRVLATLCRFGANPNILIDSKPHIGSDRLPTICRRIREKIEELGGEVRFETRVNDFELREGRIAALRVNDEPLDVDTVFLGIGHSARDTLKTLNTRGISMEAKPFQMGVRIEHPQEMVNEWQYGPTCGHPRLPAADYQLVAKNAAGNGQDLFSFCMCPGGAILPCNESAGLITTNGASRSTRKGEFANSGFVISIGPEEFGNDPIAGLEFQKRWETLAYEATGGTYQIPVQRCCDFVDGHSSSGELNTSHPIGAQWQDLKAILPESVSSALKNGLPMLDEKLPGFAGPEGIIAAPETRASSPVRIIRNPENRQSVSTRNLYPMGEGAGYAGGIVSAAVDGIRSAEVFIRRYRPVT